MNQHLISDLSIARPSSALTDKPERDRWHIIPYEAEGVSGKLLWCPVRNDPPDVSIPLPDLGLCRIHIGLYASGTWPIWLSLLGMKDEIKSWQRLHLRLSDEDWFDTMTPATFEGQPRFTFISDTYWKTASISGRSLVLAKPSKEALADMSPSVAYIRLVPTDAASRFTAKTKRLVSYFDSNFHGHYVDSVADVRSHLAPLRDSDVGTVFWTTCREDSCYYPTNVGNRLSDIGTRTGVYPYWAGRDMQRMLDRGDDPLQIVCDVAHEYGLKIFSSYRRMTCRMPPFVFPIHPNAFLLRRKDLWCADRNGEPIPHLSVVHPEVRQLMISLLTEQANRYDIDGIHLFFTRGVPFVFFERPVVEAFQKEHGVDPRGLPLDDRRMGQIRARFFLQFLRELKAALSIVGNRRSRSFPVAMNVMNSLDICAYYGVDIETMIGERLVDLLIPDHGYFAPRELGEWRCLPEHLAGFVALAKGSDVQICPMCDNGYWTDGQKLAQRATAYYRTGAHGLEVSMHQGVVSSRPEYEVRRRLGHVESLDEAGRWAADASKMVKVRTVGGFPIDLQTGIPTCG